MAFVPRLKVGRMGRGSKGKAVSKPNRRGSPEAVEKRRAARHFNDVLGGRGVRAPKLDGRTEKRRLRLLAELEAGATRSARELKPLDVLQHVHELLEMGEPLRSIRKVAKVRKAPLAADSVKEAVVRLHRAYAFRPEVYRFVGIDDDILQSAGVLRDGPHEGGPREVARALGTRGRLTPARRAS